ncbi:MAG TPA: hypothetical protein VFQ00_13905 [Terriglobales bacterium]|nr:hypothetical protein [Terriglobales bacterium]
MKTTALLFATCFFMIALSCNGADDSLLGCATPDAVARHFDWLQERSWSKISADDVISRWPSPLDDIRCQNSEGCRLLVSKDRVISGHCECCETFSFGPSESYHSHNLSLNNIIVHYSAVDRSAVVAAARQIARVFGLGESDIEKLGETSQRRFEWKDAREKAEQSYLLEVRFTRTRRRWEAYISLGADPL